MWVARFLVDNQEELKMSDVILRWTHDAEARLTRVPEGFMRMMTKKRIEEHARANTITDITLEVVESVIISSRAGMGSMMGGDLSGMPEHVKQTLADHINEAKKEDVTYYFCFVCNYAVPEKIPDICPNCCSGSEKFSLLESEYRTEAHTAFLKWSVNAIKLLESIPDDFRRKMAKNEIEAFARRNGYKVVTRDIVDERLKVWGDISKKMAFSMDWEDEARERVSKIPDHIRGMVVREMELFAKNAGEDVVSVKILESSCKKWIETNEFHVKWQ